MPSRQSDNPESTNARFGKLEKRLSNLKTELNKLTAAKPESWLRRHPYSLPLAALVIAVAGYLFGPAIFSRLFSLVFNSYFDERLNAQNVSLVLDSHIDKKLEQPIKDIHQIQLDVAKIGYRLDLQDKAAMKPQAFKQSLPGLANTLKESEKINLQVPPDVSDGIRRNLLTTSNSAPGYWDATSQFINYRSKQEIPELAAPTLPRCYDISPQVVLKIGTPSSQNPPLQWSGCTLDLGDAISDQLWDAINKARPQRNEAAILITNGLLRYHGGPISDRAFQFLRLAVFLNCRLDFSFSATPPKRGQQLSNALLATSSVTDIHLTGLRD